MTDLNVEQYIPCAFCGEHVEHAKDYIQHPDYMPVCIECLNDSEEVTD